MGATQAGEAVTMQDLFTEDEQMLEESVRRVVFDHMEPEQYAHLKAFMEGVIAVDNVPGHPDFVGELNAPDRTDTQ